MERRRPKKLQRHLTKGYRNRIRAYRHLLSAGKIQGKDIPMIQGHLAYADFVEPS